MYGKCYKLISEVSWETNASRNLFLSCDSEHVPSLPTSSKGLSGTCPEGDQVQAILDLPSPPPLSTTRLCEMWHHHLSGTEWFTEVFPNSSLLAFVGWEICPVASDMRQGEFWLSFYDGPNLIYFPGLSLAEMKHLIAIYHIPCTCFENKKIFKMPEKYIAPCM